MGAKLIKQGHSPFVPHIDFLFQFFEDLKIEDYYRYSMAWLEASDIVLVLPNSENSKGTQIEIARAKELGIPIAHSELDLKLLQH